MRKNLALGALAKGGGGRLGRRTALSRARNLAILIAVSAMSLVTAPAAFAWTETWNYATQSSPLMVSGWGSWAKTYGTLSVSRLSDTSARVKIGWSRYKYHDADDHTVYVAMYYQADKPFGSQGGGESSHDNVYPSNSWTTFRWLPSATAWGAPGTQHLHSVDGTVNTCLDIPWKFDPCAGKAQTFSAF